MLYKLIACEVFIREASLALATSPHSVDVVFTEKAAHDDSHGLRDMLQQHIHEAERSSREYDAILLGFGLCGNGTVGLTSEKTPLVIPRAHDCCTLFLGSKVKFKEHFASNPSLPFSSTGYMERGDSYKREAGVERALGLEKSYDEYVELYGEDNAKYIVETLNPTLNMDNEEVVFIQTPETAHLGYAEKCLEQAVAEGKTFRELTGDMRLIRALLHGEWQDDEFQVVQPGERIVGVYDWDQVLKADKG